MHLGNIINISLINKTRNKCKDANMYNNTQEKYSITQQLLEVYEKTLSDVMQWLIQELKYAQMC